MSIICRKDKYRVISAVYSLENDFVIKSYKVQVKFLFLWVTIKEFKELEYDVDCDFCKSEAIELYNKIINPYGTI